MTKTEQIVKISEKRSEILAVYPIDTYALDRHMKELIKLIIDLEKMSLTEDGEITHESASCENAWRNVAQVQDKELKAVKWWCNQPQGSMKNIRGLEKAVEDFHFQLNSDLAIIGIPM